MHKGAGLGADIYLIIYIGGVASALPSAGGVAWGRMASRVVCFYIKPQPDAVTVQFVWVVCRSFPTSNHNLAVKWNFCVIVVYRSFPTSNHNWCLDAARLGVVVYRSFPTSNHNRKDASGSVSRLYIVRFLHQTTTNDVYHYIFSLLYIVRFLHQTTTYRRLVEHELCCISSVSYIKPQ